MKLVSLGLLIVLLTWAAAYTGGAQETKTQFLIPTEYAENSGVGGNLVEFSRLVAVKSGGSIRVEPKFINQHGYTSSQSMMDAVAAGTLPAADVFGSGIAQLNPAFAMAAAPFVASTLAEAEAYHTSMRPKYEAAFRQIGVHLLYVTPWPPTGVWSRRPMRSVSDLEGLSMRTYDAKSKTIFAAVGAKAENLSFNELLPRLGSDQLDAVLSSGDGGMGKTLWKHLTYYNEINYAFPVSFTIISDAALHRLGVSQKRAIENAAHDIEAQKWDLLRNRMVLNEARMLDHGVTITKSMSSEFAQKLGHAEQSAF